MEAKGRIVKTTEENCHNTLEERLADQDKISFKAGKEDDRKEVIEWMLQEWQRHGKQPLGKAFEAVLHHYYQHKDIVEDLQAFKKSKGIE